MQILDLYADGGVIGPNPSAKGGTWAYVIVDREIDKHVLTGSGVITPADFGADKITNNHSEFYALVMGLEAIPSPEEWVGHVYSDSNVSLGRLFRGWAVNNLPLGVLARGRNAVMRLADDPKSIEHTLLDGHPTKKQLEEGFGKRGNPVSKWNVACDKRCTKLARQFIKENRS